MPIVNCIVPPIQAPQRAGVINAINGRSVANLVKNGNFANGLTKWFNDTSATIAVSNNTLIVTGTGTGGASNTPYAYQTGCLPVNPQGRKFYAKAKVRVTNSVCNSIIIRISTSGLIFSQINNPTINTFYALSGIVTATDSSQIILTSSIYADAATATGKVMEVQEVLTIDLTALFAGGIVGTGLEPDQATCEKLFATWFDGTTVI